MTKEQKNEFKKDINLQIKELTKEIKKLKSSVYPNQGEGTSDKVAHINLSSTEYSNHSKMRFLIGNNKFLQD